MKPKRGTGTYQWYNEGWFGGQIGSTCWMFFVAFGLESGLASIVLIACFAVSNLIAVALWMNRDKLDPYKAIQILLANTFFFTAVAMVSMDCMGILKDLDTRVKNPRSLYFLLLMFPALAIMFHLRNKPRSTEINS